MERVVLSGQSKAFGFEKLAAGRRESCFVCQQDDEIDEVIALLEGFPVLYKNHLNDRKNGFYRAFLPCNMLQKLWRQGRNLYFFKNEKIERTGSKISIFSEALPGCILVLIGFKKQKNTARVAGIIVQKGFCCVFIS